MDETAFTSSELEFFTNQELVHDVVYTACDGVAGPETRKVLEALGGMLGQANRWGQELGRREAAKELRKWAETFGVGPTSAGIRAIVREGADKIEES